MELNKDRDNATHWQQLKEYYEADKKSLQTYLESLDKTPATLPHETDTQHLLWLKARLEDGLMLAAGGIEDQPLHYVEDMQFLATLDYVSDLPYLIEDCRQQLETLAKKAIADARMKQGKV